MLGVLFGALVVTAFTVHYFLLERPRRRAVAAGGPHPTPLPLSDIIGRLPGGVFLQPTFTWSRLRPTGEVDVGIHPLLLGLVGDEPELRLNRDRGHIEKGETIGTIGSDGRRLSLRSPVSGRILEANPKAALEGGWEDARRDNGSWVVRVRAERLSDEIGSWMLAERALDWTRRRYGEIRDYILARAQRAEPALLLADGGEVPVGILHQLEDADWVLFEETFLAS